MDNVYRTYRSKERRLQQLVGRCSRIVPVFRVQQRREVVRGHLDLALQCDVTESSAGL